MQDLARKFKEEVAEAAISLFKRNGYNNVTVNEICKECGISRSVFYSSFNGKRSILEYMVEKPQHNDDASFMKFAHADNDFERIWQLFDRFIAIAYDFGPELTSTLFIMQFESPEGIRAAVHALDDLFATLATNCAKSGIIDSKEPPGSAVADRNGSDLPRAVRLVQPERKLLAARTRAAVRRDRLPRQAGVSHAGRAARRTVTARLPRQERLHSCSWLWTKQNLRISFCAKKPAARHLFQPLVFSFVSIINVQTNRLPQNSKLRSKSAVRSR